ncbi:MAG: AAA family ATPase [Phycisphaerales bacterium JB040]
MRTIAVINQKGGCGKTTTAVNLAATFADRRFRTLLVDADPQSHCAAALGVPEHQIDKDLTDALTTPPHAPLDRDRHTWRLARGLDLLPARTRLAGIEAARGGLADAPDRERRLAVAIRKLAGLAPTPPDDPELEPTARYDVAIIDCPPSIGLLTFNALVAATDILIPVETGFFALKGADKQLATIRSLSRRLGIRPRARLLPTLHHPDAPGSRRILEQLRQAHPDAVLPTVIRHDHALREAAAHAEPITVFAPASTGAHDYASLFEWLVQQADIDRATDRQMEDFERGIDPEPARHPEPVPLVTITAPRSSSPSTDTAPSGHTPSRQEDLARRARAMSAPPTGTPAPTAPQHAPAARPGSAVAVARKPDAFYRDFFTPARKALPARASARPVSTRAALARPVAIEASDPEPARPTTPSESIRRLLGVRRTSAGALFLQPASVGTSVAVAGTFNNWSPTRHPMRLNPELAVFELQIPLEPGTHEYRLIVDGVWQQDRYNPSTHSNSLGLENNVVRL